MTKQTSQTQKTEQQIDHEIAKRTLESLKRMMMEGA